MRARPTHTAFLLACVFAIAVSACGKKGDDAAGTDPPAGAQSTYGKILESAKETADRANEHTKKVEEAADPTGK